MTAADLRRAAREQLDLRSGAAGSVTAAAGVMTSASHTMAERFHGGGKLLVLGSDGCAADAALIAGEFVQPGGAGKAALPALALAPPDASGADGVAGSGAAADHAPGTSSPYVSQLRHLAEPGDILLAVSSDGCCPDLAAVLALARAEGLATVALVGGDGGRVVADALADHVFVAHSGDPAVVKEVHVTMYHALRELVHVLLEQPGLFDPVVAP